MKKYLSVLLILIMLLTLCTGLATAEGSGEKRVLTIGTTLDLTNFWEFDVYKKVQEELNMTIDCTLYNEDSFNTMLASGDLPDIVIGKNIMNLVLGNNLALDYAPYLEEYAPSMLSEAYRPTLEFSQKMMSDEKGGLYIICPCVGIHQYMGGTHLPTRGYIVHWEYYKELGCPPINNDDEYIDVLYRMHQNHPTTEDGSPTYLMGVEKSLTDMGGYRACFTRDISLNTWCPYFFKNNIFTNELVDCYTDYERSSYWCDMAFYNKIHRMGLFDIDSFTMTYDEYKAKRQKSQYMGLYFGGGPTYVAVPSNGTNIYSNVLMLTGQAPTYLSFISANSPNYDLALRFYNYVYDVDFQRVAYSGVQRKDWDYDENGVPNMTAQAIADRAASTEYWTFGGNGYGFRLYVISGYNPAVLATDGYPIDLSFMPEARIAVQSEVQLDVAKTYGVEHWYDAYTQMEGFRDFRNSGEGIAAALSDMPMDMRRTLETCNDILYTSMPRLITAETEEEFIQLRDEVIAEILSVGEQEVWEWYKVAWETPKELYNKYIAEALAEVGMEMYK
ncbi:MAG: hypothetical protein ACOX6O_06435 [Christensenellales bacterium]